MIKFNNIWLWGGAVFRIFPLCAAGLWFYAETSRQSCRCGRSLHILRKQTQPPPIGGLSLSARVWINHPASSLAADLCVRASLWWTDLGLHPFRCSQCASFTGERTNNNKRKGGKHRERSAWMCHADPVNHEQHECSVLHHGYGSRRVPAEEFFHIVPVVAVERGELARPAR